MTWSACQITCRVTCKVAKYKMEDAPIFVYGTLKKGEPNHYLLNDKTIGNSKFLGKAKLIDEYPLVISPNSNVPILLPKKGTGKVSNL